MKFFSAARPLFLQNVDRAKLDRTAHRYKVKEFSNLIFRRILNGLFRRTLYFNY